MSQSFSDGIGRDSIFSKALGGVIPSRPPSLHSNGISHSASLGPQFTFQTSRSNLGSSMFDGLEDAHLLGSVPQVESMSKYLPKPSGSKMQTAFGLHSLHATNPDPTQYDPHDILDQISASLQPSVSENGYDNPSPSTSTVGQNHAGTSHILSPSTSSSFSAISSTFNTASFQATINSLNLAAAQDAECTPRELEWFAERFKQRRIKLGVTQADVGAALAHLKLPGVGSLSQSTICRFESLTLSHNNMMALKPVLQAWLEEAEKAHRMKSNESAFLPNQDKKRKRTSIGAAEKRSLEAYFAMQPRPSSDKIAAIAEKLDLSKNVVRVWFCNQRQKKKRMKFSVH